MKKPTRKWTLDIIHHSHMRDDDFNVITVCQNQK